MTRFAGRRQKVIADLATDFLLVYSNDLSLVISPYNNSLYSGSYFVTANFTTGNKTYSDEVSFELRSRSVDDEEDDEELVFIQQSREFLLSLVSHNYPSLISRTKTSL